MNPVELALHEVHNALIAGNAHNAAICSVCVLRDETPAPPTSPETERVREIIAERDEYKAKWQAMTRLLLSADIQCPECRLHQDEMQTVGPNGRRCYYCLIPLRGATEMTLLEKIRDTIATIEASGRAALVEPTTIMLTRAELYQVKNALSVGRE